jgi:hypothetical protein
VLAGRRRGAGGQGELVPRLAVSGSLFLALLSLAALVYFIHHIARSIQIDTIMAGVERETAQPADAEAVLAEGAAVLAELERHPARVGIIGVTTTTEENEMDDRQLLGRIGDLVEEEHALERQATSDGLDEEQQVRLRHLEVQLDQCWDLLRQRRARRDAGLDPEDAHVRPEGTIEGYLQ